MGVYYSHYLIPRDNTIRPEPDRIVALIGAWIEKGFILPPDHQEANDRASDTVARFLTTPPPEAAIEPEQRVETPRGFWARLWGKNDQKPARPDPWKPFSFPPTGESLSALAKPYTLIRWPRDSNAVYPMKTVSENIFRGDHGFPHCLMIEISDDFLNIDTASYGNVGEDARQVRPVCSCGCDLGYHEDQLGASTSQRIRRICPSCGSAFRPQDQLVEIVDGATGGKAPQPGGLCNRFAIIIEFGKEMPLYVPDAKGELVDTAPKVTELFLETSTAALGFELNEFCNYG